MSLRLCAAGVAIVTMAACERLERLPAELFDSRTPRERYQAGLEQAGLSLSALGRDWIGAAAAALAAAPLVSTPFVEEGYADPAVPSALSWRVNAERGQEITVVFEWRSGGAGQVFIDIFEVRGDTVRTFEERRSADSGATSIIYEPRRSAQYIVRVQPELLRGGRFRLSLRVGPTLAFPVHNGTNHDIGSLWGAPRDGGRRSHQGVDIFARRRTPALATGEATVTRVDEDRLGGLVVWLRDRRGNSLYYAHLDSQMVREGDEVKAGDTVGLVGNTGNARRTPAHLHFSVYRRGEGPLDPYWFVARTPSVVPRLAVDTSLLGSWVRTAGRTFTLDAPAPRAAQRDTVERHTAVQVVGAAGTWLRVRLPDGRYGFLSGSRVQRTEAGIGMMRLERDHGLSRAPDGAAAFEVLVAGSEVTVLGRYGEQVLVRTAAGVTGWILPPGVAGAAAD